MSPFTEEVRDDLVELVNGWLDVERLLLFPCESLLGGYRHENSSLICIRIFSTTFLPLDHRQNDKSSLLLSGVKMLPPWLMASSRCDITEIRWEERGSCVVTGVSIVRVMGKQKSMDSL